MKLKGGMLDADGHLIERDEELLEYMEAPYKGNNTLLGFPFFPTLDGYHRGAIMARLGIHQWLHHHAAGLDRDPRRHRLEMHRALPDRGPRLHHDPGPRRGRPRWRAPTNDWFTDQFRRSHRLRGVRSSRSKPWRRRWRSCAARSPSSAWWAR